MNSRIHVAVGVITNPDKNKVLITKRTATQHLAGFWEFPGGKIEKDEDITVALYRELNEELGIVVKEAKQLTIVSYDYPDKKVLLDVWQVCDWSGKPKGKENQEIVWANINELDDYDFPEANKHIIQTLSLSPVYVISPSSCENKTRLLTVLDECFSAGVKVFQLRLDSRNEPELGLLINEISELTDKHDARLILNGLPSDINKYNVSGIHLKSKALLNYKTRPIGEDYILGASCHNEDELIHAEQINVNYAFISPVFKTASHPEAIEIGWDRFCEMSEKVKFPVYALGGMCPADLGIARTYNAYGVAMISSIWNATMSISDIIQK